VGLLRTPVPGPHMPQMTLQHIKFHSTQFRGQLLSESYKRQRHFQGGVLILFKNQTSRRLSKFNQGSLAENKRLPSLKFKELALTQFETTQVRAQVVPADNHCSSNATERWQQL